MRLFVQFMEAGGVSLQLMVLVVSEMSVTRLRRSVVYAVAADGEI